MSFVCHILVPTIDEIPPLYEDGGVTVDVSLQTMIPSHTRVVVMAVCCSNHPPPCSAMDVDTTYCESEGYIVIQTCWRGRTRVARSRIR